MPTKSKPAIKKSKVSQSKRVQSRTVASKTAPKAVLHHAKRAWHATPKFVHGAVAGGFIATVLLVSFGTTSPTEALSLDTSRDCDAYAIIKCGALTTSELQKHYTDEGVADVYSQFQITKADIDTIQTTAVAGTVHDNGEVIVDGKVVATKARTAARKNINGSAQVVVGNTTFYVRPVSVSFARSSSPAYVVMKDGVFSFAVLASCGNPVIATSKVKPVTPVAPTPPPTPAPTPQPIITPPPLATTPSPASELSTLPNTGPGALVIIAAASVIGGFTVHRTHHHLKKRRHMMRTGQHKA